MMLALKACVICRRKDRRQTAADIARDYIKEMVQRLREADNRPNGGYEPKEEASRT